MERQHLKARRKDSIYRDRTVRRLNDFMKEEMKRISMGRKSQTLFIKPIPRANPEADEAFYVERLDKS